MAYEALKHYSGRRDDVSVRLQRRRDFAEAVQDLAPAETLFIISSKKIGFRTFWARELAKG
jgi:glucose-6-phosphate isomerase